MTTTLVVTIVGPIIGAFFGLSTFFVKRSFAKADAQLQSIAESVECIGYQVTAVQVNMPTNYVSKGDFTKHMDEEGRWNNELRQQLHEIRDEVVSYRARVQNLNNNNVNRY